MYFSTSRVMVDFEFDQPLYVNEPLLCPYAEEQCPSPPSCTPCDWTGPQVKLFFKKWAHESFFGTQYKLWTCFISFHSCLGATILNAADLLSSRSSVIHLSLTFGAIPDFLLSLPSWKEPRALSTFPIRSSDRHFGFSWMRAFCVGRCG